MSAPRLILASASPRRRELLAQLGVAFETLAVDVDESVRPGETAEALVARLAIAKARAGQQRCTGPLVRRGSLDMAELSAWPARGATALIAEPAPSSPLATQGDRSAARGERGGPGVRSMDPPVIIGSDTEVELDGRIYGKPDDEATGVEMLLSLGGRTHRVWSAVAVVRGESEAVRVSRSEVCFRAISPAEARAYWASGEPRDKAGGYAIQGFGAVFITRLEGSYSGVMGLPLFETANLLREFGCLVAT